MRGQYLLYRAVAISETTLMDKCVCSEKVLNKLAIIDDNKKSGRQ